MKKCFLILISFVIGLTLVIWLYQRVGFREIWRHVLVLSWWQILLIFTLQFMTIFIGAIREKIVLDDYYKKPSAFKSIIRAKFGERAISYLTPIMYIGGEAVVLYTLKKEINVPYHKFAATLLINKLIEGIALLIFLLTGGIILLLEESSVWGGFILVLAMAFFLFIFLIVKQIGPKNILIFISRIFFLNKIKYQSKSAGETTIGERLQYLGDLIENYLKTSSASMIKSLILAFLVFIIWLIQAKLLIGFFGESVGWTTAFVLRVFILLAGLIPMPAGFASFEGAHILSFLIFGLSTSLAVSFSLVVRFGDFILTSLGIIGISKYFGPAILSITAKIKEKNYNESL